MIQSGTISVKQIGDTIYIISTRTSTTSNETAYEKVCRMIMEDAENISRKPLDISSEKSHNAVPA